EDWVGKVRIVTDSTACFEDPDTVTQYGITIVPLNIHFGDQVYRDGIDISAEEMFQRIRHARVPPFITPPSVSAFEEVYRELNKTTDQIVVILHSQQFTETFQRAQAARMSLLGRCEIAVIDSQNTSVAMGYLIQTVADAIDGGADIEEVVRIA